jgi:hypothetical protein
MRCGKCAAIAAAVLILCLLSFRSCSKTEAMEAPEPVLPPAHRLEYAVPSAAAEKTQTLKDWQQINPGIAYVLEFQDEPSVRRIPVLAAKDPAYAMRHDVYGRSDSMGSVFCDNSDGSAASALNLVIYGHSSKTKDWCFTFLKKYADPDYFRGHPEIRMEEAGGTVCYEVVSLARYDLNDPDAYLGWGDASLSGEGVPEMFETTRPYLIQQADGITWHGQQILTLVTCDMQQKDSRYVLQAVRRIS